MSAVESRYRRHRFPIEVVEQCVWLYYRFAPSYRNIEEMLAKRGVQVTYETVRKWCYMFGSLYAARLRKQRAHIGSKWHLDEVFLKNSHQPTRERERQMKRF
jgi:putative transposase